jgi:hypothetical protein
MNKKDKSVSIVENSTSKIIDIFKNTDFKEISKSLSEYKNPTIKVDVGSRSISFTEDHKEKDKTKSIAHHMETKISLEERSGKYYLTHSLENNAEHSMHKENKNEYYHENQYGRSSNFFEKEVSSDLAHKFESYIKEIKTTHESK